MNQAGTNTETFEVLSAGIDGELSKEQLRFLLRRLSHDASLQQAWSRYHVVGDGLRGQLPVLAGAGFAQRVLRAIEQEAKPALTAHRRSHWLRWSAGGAIAASVAAAALMVAQPPAGDVDRMATAVIQPAGMVDAGTPVSKPVAPAAVPPWLSGNSAGLLSQQASATLGAPFGQARPVYARRLSGYPSMPHYRTFDNNDGSYMVLLDPEQPVGAAPSRQASAVTH